MKRPSLFRRLIQKLRGESKGKPQSTPQQPAPGEKPSRPNTSSSFEPLEGRIAPAVLLLNPTTIQFTDGDGDLVTVKFTKSLFKEGAIGLNATLDKVFVFMDPTDHVRTAADGGVASEGAELAMLDLSSLAQVGLPNPADGTGISITAEPQNGMGDGLVNVGYIKAATAPLFGISLGKVVVDGDLGQIDAGNRLKSIGIESLTVNSWGTLGTTTQTATGTITPSLESNVTSGIGTLSVAGNFQDAILKVVNGTTSSNSGKISKLVIGGNLFGAADGTTDNAGSISAQGSIGSITVSNIFGGGGDDSGKINSSGKIGAVTITGDLRGGAGDDSGQLVGAEGITKVTMRDLLAGTGENSARIVTNANLGSVVLNSIIGHHTINGNDTGERSATIAAGGTISSITVAKNVSGGDGDGSGTITAGSTLTKLTIGGHLIGGPGEGSGQVIAGDKITSVSILGNSQDYTAVVNAQGAPGVHEVQAMDLGDVLDRVGTFTLSYTLPDSTVQTTAQISGNATTAQITAALEALPGIGVGKVTVAKQGGRIAISFTDEGDQPGLFTATAAQAGIVGSTGSASGAIISNGSIGKVTVNLKDSNLAALQSGTGSQSASIAAVGSLGTVILYGDIDGTASVAGSGGASITVGFNLSSVTVYGDLIGNGGELTGSITADGNISTVKVFGSLHGGEGDSSASVIAGGKFASAWIQGSLLGGGGASSASLISGADFTLPGDFGKATVLGTLTGDGVDSASIRSGGKLGTIVVGTVGSGPNGSVVLNDVLIGGDGSNSASIFGNKGAKSITVNGNVHGGGELYSGSIQTFGTMSSLKVLGSVLGGNGDYSATIFARDLPGLISITPGTLGKITIGGALTGGIGDYSAQIRSDGSMQSITVGSMTGQQGDWSASIVAGTGDSAFLNEFKTIGGIGSVKINGNVTGGIGEGSANIQAGARISAVTVYGDISSTRLQTGRDFGSIVVDGRKTLAEGSLTDVLISAKGSAKATTRADLALGKLTVSGDVESTDIRVGYDLFGDAVSGNAQIGAVKVTGDWIASDLVAGVRDVDGDGFGDADDAVINGGTISKIASILIGGNVTGTDGGTDHFGFVAQTIGSAKIGGETKVLTPGKVTIDLAGTPATNDTSIREVA